MQWNVQECNCWQVVEINVCTCINQINSGSCWSTRVPAQNKKAAMFGAKKASIE